MRDKPTSAHCLADRASVFGTDNSASNSTTLPAKCTADGSINNSAANGGRLRRTQELLLAAFSEETVARFRKKVLVGIGAAGPAGEQAGIGSTDCWIWTGAVTSRGYGCFGAGGRIMLAHRVALVLSGAELDTALTVDHLCRNKLCVNPARLEQVTGRENSQRAARTITHCRKAGHPLSGDNMRLSVRGKRICITCARAATAASDQKRKRWREPVRIAYQRELKRRLYAEAKQRKSAPSPAAQVAR